MAMVVASGYVEMRCLKVKVTRRREIDETMISGWKKWAIRLLQ